MLEIAAAVLPMVVMAIVFVALAVTAIRATDGAGRRASKDDRPRSGRSRRPPPSKS